MKIIKRAESIIEDCNSKSEKEDWRLKQRLIKTMNWNCIWLPREQLCQQLMNIRLNAQVLCLSFLIFNFKKFLDIKESGKFHSFCLHYLKAKEKKRHILLILKPIWNVVNGTFFNTSTNLGRLILNFYHCNQTVLLLWCY